MPSDISEITMDYEEDGVLVRKELEKKVLSKGAWTTIMFKYQEINRKTGEYKEPKASILRFRKMNGEYRKQSGFNISSGKQALMIAETLTDWFEGDENEK